MCSIFVLFWIELPYFHALLLSHRRLTRHGDEHTFTLPGKRSYWYWKVLFIETDWTWRCSKIALTEKVYQWLSANHLKNYVIAVWLSKSKSTSGTLYPSHPPPPPPSWPRVFVTEKGPGSPIRVFGAHANTPQTSLRYFDIPFVSHLLSYTFDTLYVLNIYAQVSVSCFTLLIMHPLCNVFYTMVAFELVPGLVGALWHACAAHALYYTPVFFPFSPLSLSSCNCKCNPNFLRLVCPCLCHKHTQYWRRGL